MNVATAIRKSGSYSLRLLQQHPHAPTRTSTILKFFAHWGGFGLVPLAILDNSLVPTFGMLDILTAWLAATHGKLWYYYATMATLGAIAGAFITYRLGQKTGRAWIERRVGKRRSGQVEYALERWGFGAIFVSTVAPPPCPTAVFLLAAGAFGYRMRDFFIAVISGRAIRYGLLTLIAAHYGRHIMRYVRHPGKYALPCLAATLAIAAVTALVLWMRRTPGAEPMSQPVSGD